MFKSIKLFNDLYNFLIPPQSWKLPVFFILAVFTGIILFILYVSKAPSYLSDNPQTCVNCHIMAPQYSSWFHSSHRDQASCNDCHVPHDNIFNHFYFKGMDGLRHSAIFTLRMEPQVIVIRAPGEKVVYENCKRCHENNIFMTSMYNEYNDRKCWSCHRNVPHGKVRSLSSVPFARIPLTGSMVPKWLDKKK